MYRFAPVRPSETIFDDAWSTSFATGGLIFTVRFEAGPVDVNGWGGFFEEARISAPPSGVAHIVKFDNSFNDADPGREFLRLPRDRRLPAREIRLLERALVEAVRSFCIDHSPDTVVGLPNDPVLGRWYRRMVADASLPTYISRVVGSSFHPHPVLLLERI